jgi:hypothetical protein
MLQLADGGVINVANTVKKTFGRIKIICGIT